MGDKATVKVGFGEQLYELGRWASFPVQAVGYLPLTSKTDSTPPNNKTFKFSWSSFLPYFSAFLTLASFSWCLMYFWRYQEFKAFIEFKSPTETGAFNLMILATTLSSIYAKLFGLVNGSKYEAFWEKTRFLLNEFHNSFDMNDFGSIEEFQQIRTSCKIEYFLMLVPVGIHVLYFYFWMIVASLIDEQMDPNSVSPFDNADTQLYMGLGFGYLIAFLHVSNSIWMNFFVKIYSQCLLLVCNELQKLQGFQVKILAIPSQTNEKSYTNSNPIRKTSYAEPHFQSESLSFQLKCILDKLAHVDQELTRFNGFFGTLLLIQVSNCVINLLVYSFFACMWMGRGRWKNGFLETVVPLYIYGKELLDMGTVAENLSFAADKLLATLAEDVMLDNLSEEIFLRIQIISTQLCTKPPVISARQFFNINRGLVTSVMSGLATFLVVLVQFREQDDEDAKQINTAVSTNSTN